MNGPGFGFAGVSAAALSLLLEGPRGLRDARAPAEASRGQLPAAEHLALADGRNLLLRPVRPADAPAEHAFVAALSPHSRRMRFHGALKVLPPSVVQAMTSIDFDAHVALVALAGCADGASRIVADARYVRGAPGRAEFALAVADDWQGAGLGRALLHRLVQQAARRGIGRLDGSVLVDNAPMLALMQRLGARVRHDPTDATLVQVSLHV